MMLIKRKWKWCLFIVALVLMGFFLQFMGWGFGYDKSKIIISYQTTRITGPLDENGNIDYLEYLNQQASEGVTPENNFEYIVRKVSGVELINENIRKEYLKRIGLNEADILKKEDRFQNVYDFLESKMSSETDTPSEKEKIEERINGIFYSKENDWLKKDDPLIAEWLKANTRNLDLIAEGSKLSRSYTPYLIVHEKGSSSSSLLQIDHEPCHEKRMIALSFRVRAMDRFNNKDIDGAQEDFMTTHRISRLVCNNSVSQVETFAGKGVEFSAYFTALGMLESDQINKKQIFTFINKLNSLERISNFTRILDHYERFLFLESAIQLNQGTSIDASNKSIDYNSILKWGNEKYDALVEASKIKDSIKRSSRVGVLSDQVEGRVKELNLNPINNIRALLKAGSLGKYTTDRIRDSLYVTISPIVAGNKNREYMMYFYLGRTKIAYALKAYQLDNKQFPEKLESLVPEYLNEIPLDPFTEKYPIYKTTEKGFIIYSLGPNQKDDKGFGTYGIQFGEIECDDILIEYPRKKREGP